MHQPTSSDGQPPYSRRTFTGAMAAMLVLLAAPFSGRATAQQATPAATPVASDPHREFLFVQTFGPGQWAPKPGSPGIYTLTLTNGTSQTVFFSDRPDRIVGTVPTTQLFEELGFTPFNGPNAAVVAKTITGEEVLVVELFNPVYDESNGDVTITYDAKLLQDYREEGLAYLAQQQTNTTLPEDLHGVSLFIDDCPDLTTCAGAGQGGPLATAPLPGAPIPTCWDWNKASCQPCNGNGRKYYRDLCDQTYPEFCRDMTPPGCLVGNLEV